jgi:hypothetical protein
MTKTGERRLENNQTGFKLATANYCHMVIPMYFDPFR